MQGTAAAGSATKRMLVRRGLTLEYLTLGWNVGGTAVSIIAARRDTFMIASLIRATRSVARDDRLARVAADRVLLGNVNRNLPSRRSPRVVRSRAGGQS